MSSIKHSIRVFLSSTFLDMQDERNYLNQMVFPKFKVLCQQRGVSFFACDLRWGITEDQVKNKQTIELCLKQVEESIPFFIGLYGSRYGWIPEEEYLPFDILDSNEEVQQLSATAIEFYHFCQKTMTYDNSFFAKKADSLVCHQYDDDRQDEIEELLESVHKKTGKPIFIYDSIESLGEKIYSVLSEWLNTIFPDSSLQIQMEHYNNLLGSRYQEHDVLDQWQRKKMNEYNKDIKPKEPYNPFFYAGDSYFGYEYFENAVSRYKRLVLIEPEGSELICNRYWEYVAQYSKKQFIKVYLDASPNLCNAYAVCSFIYNALANQYPDIVGSMKERISDDSLDDLIDLISITLRKIPKDRPLVLCITNMHLMNPNDVNYSLSFLSSFGGENVTIYITTTDKSQTELLAAADLFFIKEFSVNVQEEGRLALIARFQQFLHKNGKTIEQEIIDQMVLSLGRFSDKDVLMLAEYFINYSTFENIRSTVNGILKYLGQGNSPIESILRQRLDNIPDKEKETAETMLRMLSVISIDEDQLFEIVSGLDNVNQIEFAYALDAIRPVLKYTDRGYSFCNETAKEEKRLSVLDNRIVEGICDVLFDRLHRLNGIPQLETAYDLLYIITCAESMKNAVRFSRDSSVFYLSEKYDYHLLRRAWIFLINKKQFNVKELYPDDFSLDNGSLSYSKCNLIMLLEHSIFHDSKMECFLDIPYFYSTDIESHYKKRFSYQEREIMNKIGVLRKNGQLEVYAETMEELVKRENLDLSFIMFIYENLLAYKKESGREILEEEIKKYFRIALWANNARLIADALTYLNEYVESFHSSSDFQKVLSRFQYY